MRCPLKLFQAAARARAIPSSLSAGRAAVNRNGSLRFCCTRVANGFVDRRSTATYISLSGPGPGPGRPRLSHLLTTPLIEPADLARLNPFATAGPARNPNLLRLGKTAPRSRSDSYL